MTHKLEKASAETHYKTRYKDTVHLARLLTYMFVGRKISEFMFHVLDIQTLCIDKALLGFLLVDLLTPHCVLRHGL